MRARLVLALPAVALASRCPARKTRSECLVFRFQDHCVWDTMSGCVDDVPCEARDGDRCEYELTSSMESWDASRNRCFLDGARGCRATDECLGVDSALACVAGGCEWRRRCTPADLRNFPGPGHCARVCVPPGTPPQRASEEPETGTPPQRASEEPETCAKKSHRCSREAPKLACCPGLACKSFATGGDICVAAETVAETSMPEAAAPDAPTADAPTATTTGGRVSGTAYGAVDFFGGVPYAAAPVGELRWAPPTAVAWSGTFEAQLYGAGCVQSLDALLFDGTARCASRSRDGACRGVSEDCLNANVWAPSAPAPPRAVMVWIHGGCFVSGSNAAAAYDGFELSSSGDVVVVSVNYRLGALGFLGSEKLRSRDPRGTTGNYGLLDTIFALEWVRDNAAAFGGDAGRVTIFGQSSGAGSVSHLLAIERAWPLFQRAILESGSGSFWTYQDMAAAEGNFRTAATAAACGAAADAVPCLLNASSATLAAAVTVVPCRDACTWAPAIDDALVKGRVVRRARQGLLRPNTSTISGFNLNDGAMFVPGYPAALEGMDGKGLEDYFRTRFDSEHVAALDALFPVPGGFPGADGRGYSSDFYAAQRCETDYNYACNAFWLSEAAERSWIYHFVEPTYIGLALHAAEIEYVFGTLSDPTPAQAAVSANMRGWWANFAKAGDPNGAGLPAWPAWADATGFAVLNISAAPAVYRVPTDAYPGCAWFDANYDYLSGCLPRNDDDAAR